MREEQSAAALEIMSRFAVDPHWLIYLPPTMSPYETSDIEGYLEYPEESFRYYEKNGVKQVVCEKKHMGSRAVIILCRDIETAKKRFQAPGSARGIIYSRTGRRFFSDISMETELLDSLDEKLTKTGFWEDFRTDWVCLDAEIMPWSEKAMALLRTQYGPIGKAGRETLAASVSAIRQGITAMESIGAEAKEGLDLRALLPEYEEKQDAVEKYVQAYREYCWDVADVSDLRVAPFHLLAAEGAVFSDKTHCWHMDTLKKYCTGLDPIFIATDHILVDVSDPASVKKGIDWWLDLTSSGGEGMVVKPLNFISKYGRKLLQPAVKCRGSEYLRIIYGPEYLFDEHLTRLKKRSLTRKRELALKEFALGMESLERFIRNEPLNRIHQCVFGILAMESEPVDPRL